MPITEIREVENMNESTRRVAPTDDSEEATNELGQQLLRFNALARASLVNWDIDQNSQLSLIKHRENAVYELKTPGGERYALRIHRAGYHSDAALRSELQWMTALNDAGLRTPQSVRTRTGDWFAVQQDKSGSDAYQIDMLSWVDGKALGSVEQGLSDDVATLVSNYRQVGVLAARLHNLTESWPKPDGFTRQAWDIDGCFSENAIWGRFHDLEVLTSEQMAILDTARKLLVALLTDLGKGPEVYGLIHCDLLPENLLGSGDDIYLIDFDDAGYGWYLFEFATSLFFLLGEPYFDDVFDALVEGFRSERALPDEQLALLPAFFLLRALVYLGWAHTRSETDTAKEMTPMIVEVALEMAEAFISETNN
jgi:Ser/Thr protein kinase RdoA (MazF antagonist)